MYINNIHHFIGSSASWIPSLQGMELPQYEFLCTQVSVEKVNTSTTILTSRSCVSNLGSTGMTLCLELSVSSCVDVC